MSEFDDFVAAIESHTGRPGKRVGKNTRLLCPAHDDHHPSLDVAEGDDGRALVVCRSHGCTYEQILDALGIEDRRNGGTPQTIYVYTDEQGEPLIEVGRFPQSNGDKTFLQRRPGALDWKGGVKGVRRCLYRLPRVLTAVERGETIYVVEGEKDVQRLELEGVTATTSPMGAKNWRDEYAAPLTGATVVLIADRDDEGIAYVEGVSHSLARVGATFVLVQAAVVTKGADVSDHLRAGFSLDDLVPLAPNPFIEDEAVEQPTKPTGERMRITTIADVQAKRVVWLEQDLVARAMLTGLVAPGGTVKGLWGILLAAKIAERGERTLFLCSEDALDYIIRPRFDAAGCDGKLAYALSIDGVTGTRALHFPSDLPVLAEAIAKVKPQLVIIDPIASYLDAGLDMAKNNQMRGILQPLIALAAEANVAIVPVYHLGKERGRGAIGSVAFEDACRQVLTAARDDEDEDVRHLELTKSNIGRTGYGRKLRIVEVPLDIDGETVGVAKLVDEGRSNKSVHALLEKRGAPGPEPEKREAARVALCELLIDAGPAGVNADEAKTLVAEATGASPSTVWRAFDELKAEKLASATASRDEYGSISEWRWVAKSTLLLGRGDA